MGIYKYTLKQLYINKSVYYRKKGVMLKRTKEGGAQSKSGKG
jgi:hypothetical protein